MHLRLVVDVLSRFLPLASPLQAQRWRCGRYRPERTLVAPLSVTDAAGPLPPLEEDRELTFVFRGSCEQDTVNAPQFSGKRLRRYLVKLFSRSGRRSTSGVLWH